MGKSIRSKEKRKHRAEFRRTIGTAAYNKQFEKTQAKLQECIAKQTTSMEGLERLSKQLGHSEVPEPQEFDNKSNKMVTDGEGVADALETTATSPRPADLRGENKAPAKKTRKGRKYSYMHKGKGNSKQLEKKEKPKPKYFCQF